MTETKSQNDNEDEHKSYSIYTSEQRTEYFIKLERWLLEAYAWHSFVATIPYILGSSQIAQGSKSANANATTSNRQENENTSNQRINNEPTPTVVPAAAAARTIGITYRIPPVWKRYAAELIDSILLFLLKMCVTFISVDVFNIIEIEKYYLGGLQPNLRIDYKMAIELATGLLAVELVHKIFVCFFETSWLQHGINGRIGGATPGKLLLRLKVVQCRNVTPVGLLDQDLVVVVPGTDLGLLPALGRSILKNVILAFVFPICFSMCFFRFNRTGYDLVCNSIVVEDANINGNNNINNNNNNNNINNNNNNQRNQQ